MDRWQRRRYASLIGYLHPRPWTWVIYSNHLSSQRQVLRDIVISASSMWELDSVGNLTGLLIRRVVPIVKMRPPRRVLLPSWPHFFKKKLPGSSPKSSATAPSLLRNPTHSFSLRDPTHSFFLHDPTRSFSSSSQAGLSSAPHIVNSPNNDPIVIEFDGSPSPPPMIAPSGSTTSLLSELERVSLSAFVYTWRHRNGHPCSLFCWPCLGAGGRNERRLRLWSPKG